jgi:hypothetical protein
MESKMDQIEFPQTEEIVETVEVVDAVEDVSLHEATEDPGARVEHQDISQAEAVEAELTVVMDDTGASTSSQPDVQATPDEPQSQARDPLTGKGYGGQNQSQGSETEEEEYTVAEPLDEADTPQVQGTFTGTVDQEAEDLEADDMKADPHLIDGNDRVYQVGDESGDVKGAIGTDNGFNEDLTGDLDQQRLGPENLPDKGRIPVGMGPNGALYPGGGKMPGGKGGFPGGSKTNGGGPPVGNYGGGSKGNGGKKGSGKVTYWGENDGMSFSGSSNDSCEKETVKQSKRSEITTDGNVIVDCGDGTQYQLYWENGGDIEVSKRGMTLDGDQPMPYTGNWSSGEDPDPKTPIGGLDREAGKVYSVLGGGSSKTGGKTPGDKDGEDDSGKFLGDPNLSGDDWVPPPDDDIPYRKLNQYNAGI